jgi:hypothetical protein
VPPAIQAAGTLSRPLTGCRLVNISKAINVWEAMHAPRAYSGAVLLATVFMAGAVAFKIFRIDRA